MSVATTIDHIRSLGMRDYVDAHLALMEETVSELQPTHIFEYGTSWGESARIWHEFTDDRTQIHTTSITALDARCGERRSHRIGHWIRDLLDVPQGRIHFHQGEGRETTLALCYDLKPIRPLIFIDDNHTYQSNLDALHRFSWRVPQAVVIVHDSGEGGEPALALKTFLSQRPQAYDATMSPEGSGIARLWPRR